MISETKKDEEVGKDGASLFGVIRERLSENCLWGRSHSKILQRNSMCKGPGVGTSMVCSRNNQKTKWLEQLSQGERGSRWGQI